MVEFAPAFAEGPHSWRVEAALLWLEEQDRQEEADRQHEAATQALCSALRRPKPIGPAALEAHGQRRHGTRIGNVRVVTEAISRTPVGRACRIRSLEAADPRRVACRGVLVASLIFVAIRRQTRQNDAEQAATVVSDMLELSELEQAAEFLKKLGRRSRTPRVSSHDRGPNRDSRPLLTRRSSALSSLIRRSGRPISAGP